MSHQSPASTTVNSSLVGRKRRRGQIEKKRRDKINASLGELRRLVPAAFEKQGSSKLEKAEILQMTVAYLRLLHEHGLADILVTKAKQLEHLQPPPPPSSRLVLPGPAAPVQSQSAASVAAAVVSSHSQAVLSQHQMHHQGHQQAAQHQHHHHHLHNLHAEPQLHHHQATHQHHHSASSMVQAASSYQACQQTALAAVASRASPANSDHFQQLHSSSSTSTSSSSLSGQQEQSSAQALDVAATASAAAAAAVSYQHPRALYQYQGPTGSSIYPSYQDHLPRYYYSGINQ